MHRTLYFATSALPELAGVEGFEPPYGGIKTRCLTAWRHPNLKINRRRTPGVARSAGRQPLKQGRVVQSARQECFESRRQLTRDFAAFGRLTGDENTGPRAGQA